MILLRSRFEVSPVFPAITVIRITWIYVKYRVFTQKEGALRRLRSIQARHLLLCLYEVQPLRRGSPSILVTPCLVEGLDRSVEVLLFRRSGAEQQPCLASLLLIQAALFQGPASGRRCAIPVGHRDVQLRLANEELAVVRQLGRLTQRGDALVEFACLDPGLGEQLLVLQRVLDLAFLDSLREHFTGLHGDA